MTVRTDARRKEIIMVRDPWYVCDSCIFESNSRKQAERHEDEKDGHTTHMEDN